MVTLIHCLTGTCCLRLHSILLPCRATHINLTTASRPGVGSAFLAKRSTQNEALGLLNAIQCERTSLSAWPWRWLDRVGYICARTVTGKQGRFRLQTHAAHTQRMEALKDKCATSSMDATCTGSKRWRGCAHAACLTLSVPPELSMIPLISCHCHMTSCPVMRPLQCCTTTS